MKKTLFLIVLCMLAFTACDNSNPEINIRMETDYSEIINAIGDANRSLSNKLALIEAAMKNGLAENDALLGLIQEALSSMGGTLDEKLAAVEAVMKARTTTLETKLALVEAAVNKGFADNQTERELLQQAVAALAGSLEEIIATLESAVRSQTLSLETKLGLIEATVRHIETTDREAYALILEALAALEGTTEEKLAAVEAAVEAQSAGLATKVGLIAAALETGFLNETAAIRATQTALDSSLQVVDRDLLSVKDSVVAGLDSLSKELSTEEMVQALQGIRDAVNAQTQSTAAMLQALLRAINEFVDGLNRAELTWLGDPTETITLWRGETFGAKLRVKPASLPLTKDSLRLEIVSDKRYFLPELGPGDGADHFYIRSLEAVAGEEGVYVATVKADAPVVLWEDSQLSVVMRNSGKEVATDPFPVTIVPRPTEGLRIWHYPRASFKMPEINGVKLAKDSLGVIYAALESREFVSKDDSRDVRTYSASFLDSVWFVEEEFELHKYRHILVPDDDSLANVHINFVKGQEYIGFYPDTADSKVWRNFQDSIGHMNLDLKGKLVVTDQWKKKDTIDDFHLGWWNTHSYSDENLKCSINDIDDVQHKGQLKDTIKLESLFDFCGVKNTSLAVVPEYKRSVDRSRFIYPQNRAMTGKFVDGNWPNRYEYENDEWNILLNVGDNASAGSYSMEGIVTVSFFPKQSETAFKVQQLYVHYELKLTVTSAH